ncbi:hypothetical protein BHF71_01160 [Vulcanibacillus modesticaldus]|uniref:TATA-box binding protein n=1 Tax=Vulcanibacillus modesticaldus TaxID=337097 RepID=A0A1D2YVS8_9BACI|nr:YwmB family TATA-box binding protein [Vulcanibacillus modesticaldus]OEF99814.1 hypothetical protein BHF71_01160 [Vulcanibacillus modesticaldus]
MKNKVIIAVVLLFALFFSLGITVKGNGGQDVEYLIKAFNKTGAKMDTYWLNFGIPYGKYEDDQQLLQIGNRLSSSFKLPVAKELIIIGAQKVYSSKGTWGDGTEVELQIKKYSQQSNDLYLLFHLKGNSSTDDLLKYYNLLEKILDENNLYPKINSCVQGNIDDKLSNVDQFVLIEELLASLEAKEIEKLDTDLVKSISAYSPKITNSIWTGDKKMNIQIATHVSNLQQKTIITMGTPIITIEY